MQALPDYLDYNLKVIFVGYNPSEKSAKTQYHYAGRGNQFWRLLYESGLTKKLYEPKEDKQLLTIGYGLTNIVPRPSQSSSDLTTQEMQVGAEALRKKIAEYCPKIICFLGKEVYRRYAGLKTVVPVSYGLVNEEETVKGVREFVAPNPSARSTVPYTEKLSVFQQLNSQLSYKEFYKKE